MRRIALAALAVSLASGAPAAARECDRSCTLEVGDAVLTALQTGQFGKLLPRNLRLTENGRDIRPADSQLRAFKKVTYLHAFAEPKGGVAGFHGAAEAYGGAAVFSLRLKLKGDQVAEIETLVVRRTEALSFSPETLGGKPERDQTLPPEQRRSRAGMIAITDIWLDRLAQGQPAGEASATGCTLTGNGARFTSCGNVVDLRGATLIRDRRWPMVDEAQGLVWALAVAEIATTTEGVDLGPSSRPTRRAPHSVRISALFRVGADQVTDVELVLKDAPPAAMTGWVPPRMKRGSSPEQPAAVTSRQ